MSRRLAFVALLLALVAPSGRARAASLLDLVPARPLVAVHATDLGDLAKRVRSLPAAKTYLGSHAHDAYQDSKLALKLAARAKRLGELAGTSLTLETLLDNAHGETVLALYDIGELDFLVLARMGAADQAKLDFVQRRADFTERVYAGRTYRAKIDFDAGLAFVFYQDGDLLLVASSVDLLEGALLARTGGAEAARLTDDEDFQKLAAMAQSDSDAVMFLDLTRLVKDRYFRNYWVWRNTAGFAPWRAARVGFSCDGKTIHETRALLGSEPPAAPQTLTYAGEGLQEFVPGGAELTAQLAAHFGWPLTEPTWDNGASARLLVVEPYVDPATGLVDVHLGAAVRTNLDPTTALQAIADSVAAQRTALRSRLQVIPGEDGTAELTLLPGLSGAYAKRRGDLLLLASDPAFLDKLAAKVAATDDQVARRVHATGSAASLLATFLRQTAQLDNGFGGHSAFTADVLPHLLDAAGRFDAMTSTTRPVKGGLLQETTWR